MDEASVLGVAQGSEVEKSAAGQAGIRVATDAPRVRWAVTDQRDGSERSP